MRSQEPEVIQFAKDTGVVNRRLPDSRVGFILRIGGLFVVPGSLDSSGLTAKGLKADLRT